MTIAALNSRRDGQGPLDLAVRECIPTSNIGSCTIFAADSRGVPTATNDPTSNLDRAFAQSVEEFLGSRGEGMLALVLETQDLQKTAEVLSNRGLTVNTVTDDALEIARTDTFGALIRIESK